MINALVQVPAPVPMSIPSGGGYSGYGDHSRYSGYPGGLIPFDKDQYGRPPGQEQIRERVRSFEACRIQQQANINNIVNRLSSALQNQPGVVTNSPSFTPSIPIHNHSSGWSSHTDSPGGFGIPAAGYFNG